MNLGKVCPQCGTEYGAEQRFCASDGTALRLRETRGDLVGEVLGGRYHILRKLGEGGMGEVYLASHVKMGRECAIKVIRPALLQDSEALARFTREASNASRIANPNVAAIYDFGETEDGLVYLAMEYVDGEPLSALLAREKSVAPARAAVIVQKVADALHDAHALGIVHRDLKPDNIMLARGRAGSDIVKVVDFGIAKVHDAKGQTVTRTGLVIGTPDYMSPEQLSGEALDGRSDIYALGLVAFHLLTGTLPFAGETQQESMIRRLTEAPRTLREARNDITWPESLQRVLDRALSRTPRERYQTATEFADDFSQAVAEGERAGPAPVSHPDQQMPGLAGFSEAVGARRAAAKVEEPSERGAWGSGGTRPMAFEPERAPDGRSQPATRWKGGVPVGIMIGGVAVLTIVAGAILSGIVSVPILGDAPSDTGRIADARPPMGGAGQGVGATARRDSSDPILAVPIAPSEPPSPSRAPMPNAAIRSGTRTMVVGVNEATAESLRASAEMAARVRMIASDSLRRTIMEQVDAARRVAGLDSMLTGVNRGDPRPGRSGRGLPFEQFDRIIVRNAVATRADSVELEPIRLALEGMLRSPLTPPERLRASMAMTQVRAMLMRDPDACDALAASVRQLGDRARAGPLRLILRRDCGTGR